MKKLFSCPHGVSATTFLAAIALLALLTGCAEEKAPTEAPIPRVRVFEVGERAHGQTRTLSGVLVAADSSSISFGVSGTVDRVNAEAGEIVRADQILAHLDARPLQLTAQRARADLASARAQLVEADQDMRRKSALFEKHAVSRAEVDIASTTLRAARATLDGAKSALEQAERDLSRVELSAPFAGRIAARSIEPFQEITANETAFVVQTEDALVASAQVPETLIRYVDYGQAVQVRFPSIEGLEIVGAVSQIEAQAGAGNAFPIEVRVPADVEGLRPGLSATLTFNFDGYLEGKTAYMIPISAIAIDVGIESGGSPHDSEAPVFVYDESTDTLEVRTVRIGGLRENQLEVFEGLAPGDLIVSAGVAFLRDGMRVERWDPNAGLSDG